VRGPRERRIWAGFVQVPALSGGSRDNTRIHFVLLSEGHACLKLLVIKTRNQGFHFFLRNTEHTSLQEAEGIYISSGSESSGTDSEVGRSKIS
jgi:hypothetical protein